MKLTQEDLDTMAAWCKQIRESGVRAITGVEVPDEWLAALLIEHARMSKALEAADALAAAVRRAPRLLTDEQGRALTVYEDVKRRRSVPRGLR